MQIKKLWKRAYQKKKCLNLGGGMTGLAGGYASGLPVYEAADQAGGICSFYYMRPNSTDRLRNAPSDGEASCAILIVGRKIETSVRL